MYSQERSLVSHFSNSSGEVGFHLMAPMAMDVVEREMVSRRVIRLLRMSRASWILLKDEKSGERVTEKSDEVDEEDG